MGSTEQQRMWMWQTMLAAVGTYNDGTRVDTIGRTVPDRTEQGYARGRLGMIFEPGTSLRDRRSDSLPRGPTHARKFNN